MRRSASVLIVCVALGVLVFPAPPVSAGDAWVRPVAGRVVRAFRAPLTRYGSGHLGVDLAARPGTPVRAAGAGTVVFAGVVADARHVVVLHAGGLRTSYSFLASIRVRRGETVRGGQVLGTTGGRGEHHDAGVLHLGLRVGGTFVDPMRLFASVVALSARVHLAPIGGDPSAEPASGAAFFGSSEAESSAAGSSEERRRLVAGLAGPPPPVVVRAPRVRPEPTNAPAPICGHRIAPWCAWLARSRIGPG
jgi:murein DD-endopeptidase MepM/ murein hydrolase activator NlpD